MSKKKKPKPNYNDFKCFNTDINNNLSEREKQLRDELKEYRKNRKKAWYL